MGERLKLCEERHRLNKERATIGKSLDLPPHGSLLSGGPRAGLPGRFASAPTPSSGAAFASWGAEAEVRPPSQTSLPNDDFSQPRNLTELTQPKQWERFGSGGGNGA